MHYFCRLELVASLTGQDRTNAVNLKNNVLRGIYGNRAELHNAVTLYLSETARHYFYRDDEIRETLADMPEDEHAERLA